MTLPWAFNCTSGPQRALNAEILCEYKLHLKNCFMIFIPSFAPAHLQCCYYAVNAAGGVFFLWLLIQLRQYVTVVVLGSFSIKQTSVHFSHRDHFWYLKHMPLANRFGCV